MGKKSILDELKASVAPARRAWWAVLSPESQAGMLEVRTAWRAGDLKHLTAVSVSRFLHEKFSLTCSPEAVRAWLDP